MLIAIGWFLASIAFVLIATRRQLRLRWGRSGGFYFSEMERRTAGLACALIAACGGLLRLAPYLQTGRFSSSMLQFRLVIGDWNLVLLCFSVLLFLGGLRAIEAWRESRSIPIGMAAIAELSVATIIVGSNLFQILAFWRSLP
jgi:hypothetical protein